MTLHTCCYIAVLEVDDIVGPGAPSSSPITVRCWGLVEGWEHSAPHPTRVMYCLLTLSAAGQQKLCLGLKSAAVRLDPEVYTTLTRRGNISVAV